ncbi:MAG: Ig-like domain-containing protein [Verrucomicrobia bacterium]|nr:MAG: Ig-like domain-containing protein [Verrucomicrobiota bacterium]
MMGVLCASIMFPQTWADDDDDHKKSSKSPPPPTATIDLTVQQYIGDESELIREKYFNLHSSYSGDELVPADLEFVYDELNVGLGRSFWSPYSAYPGVAPYPTEEQAAAAGAAAIANHKKSPMFPYRTNRIVVTDHPRNVLELDEDPAVAAQWAVRYFRHYYEDDYRPIFYEPMNEPFVHAQDFVPGPWDPDANALVTLKMAEWFREIGKAFDQSDLAVNVIGYSAAWPSLELWDFGHWEAYQKMFMDVAGDYIDAFSTHLYDRVNVTGQNSFRSGANSAAILDLIETYSTVKWGYAKPHAITEYGGIVDGYPIEYSAERSAKDLPSINHLLFGLLERQDRILTSIPFITGKSAWFYRANNFHPYNPALWRPDPDKIVGTKVNGFLLTEKVKFYQLWADVQGNRAYIRSNDPDVLAHAFVYGPHAHICLNNFEDESKEVLLQFVTEIPGLQNVRIRRLHVPEGQGALFSEDNVSFVPPSIVLAPHETVILRLTYDAPIAFTKQIRTRNYYAPEHVVPIVAKKKLRFHIDGVAGVKRCKGDDDDDNDDECEWDDDDDEDSDDACSRHWFGRGKGHHRSFAHDAIAVLRMGIGRTHDLSKSPRVKINGHKVKVPDDWTGYDQANRSEFFGVIEIPFPARYLKENNKIDVRFPDTGGRVSSMVLEVDRVEPYAPVPVEGIAISDPVFSINKDKSDKLRVSFTPANATDKYVTWTSSNPAVATVGEDGTVYPVAPGEAVITATSHDGGFTASSQVTVQNRLSIPDDVTILSDLSDVIASDSYLIDIQYSASTQRDVAIEMRVDGKWKGIKQVTVPEGTGVVTLNLTFPSPIPPGTGTWIASIREVGGDWRTTLASHKIDGTTIRPDPNAPQPEMVRAVTDLQNLPMPSAGQPFRIQVEYSANESRFIVLEFWGPPNGTSWRNWGYTEVPAGTGVATVTVWPGANLTPGSGYRWVVGLRETTHWSTTVASDDRFKSTNIVAP